MTQPAENKNRNGIRFYVERSSNDLLFVWANRASAQHQVGCATAIAGHPGSVCWPRVSDDYLYRRCRRVTRAEVERRVASEPEWKTLLVRADWMQHEMTTRDEAVLPF